MSDEEKKEINEVPPQDIKPDLQDEEEEPVDEELQKKMKDVKIDDSVFSGEHKKNEKKNMIKKIQKKKELILWNMQVKIIFK